MKILHLDLNASEKNEMPTFATDEPVTGELADQVQQFVRSRYSINTFVARSIDGQLAIKGMLPDRTLGELLQRGLEEGLRNLAVFDRIQKDQELQEKQHLRATLTDLAKQLGFEAK